MTSVARPETRKETTINLRISQQTKNLIDKAAEAAGKSRTEFVVEIARKHAIDVLLDQKIFELNEEQFAALNAVLDNPPKANAELKELMSRTPPWET